MPEIVENPSRTEDQADTSTRERINPALMLVLCSVAILVLSQVIRADVPQEWKLAPFVTTIIAIILFLLGAWSLERKTLPNWLDKPIQAGARWMGIQPGQFISLCFSPAFSVLTCVAAGFQYKMHSPAAAVISWLLGIGLVVYSGWNKSTPLFKMSRGVLLVAAGLFAGALALRAFNTATIPIVLSGDEASSGLFSTKFITGELNNLFITGWFSFPMLNNFLQSLSIRIFGQTTQALRLLAALCGALTVALVYLIGREMFGNLAGGVAAIFLAGMHFHNHFSRIGLNNIWDGLFFTFVLGCVWIGWKKNSRIAWLLAGVGLGLAQYFYATGRLLVGVVGLWVLLAGIFDWKKFKKTIPDLVLMALVTLIVILPVTFFFVKHPNEFMAPMNRVTIFGEWMDTSVAEYGGSKLLVILDQVKLSISGYFDEPTRAWYTPGVPLLRAIPGAVFLLGLALTLLHPKDERHHLLWIWLGAIAMAVASSESAPAAQRYVAAAPALALMIGFSLSQLGSIFSKWLPKGTQAIQVSIIIISLLLGADDARFYYLKYTPNSDFSGFNGMVAQTLANKLKNEPAGTELYFSGFPMMGYDSISSLPYLAPQMNYVNVGSPWEEAEIPEPQGKRVLFVFLPNHESDRAAMELAYPGGTWTEERTSKGETLYWMYDFTQD